MPFPLKFRNFLLAQRIMAICQRVPKLRAVGGKEQERGKKWLIESLHLRDYEYEVLLMQQLQYFMAEQQVADIVVKKWGNFNPSNFYLISLTSKYVISMHNTLICKKIGTLNSYGMCQLNGGKPKGTYRTRSKRSNVSSGEVCVKQESPKNKGTLVCGGLFLTAILGLRLMKCIRDLHEALCLLHLLCEVVPAFVRAVSQVFLLQGSRTGNRRIYLQMISVKPYYPSALRSFCPPPSLNSLVIHGPGLPCLPLCHRSVVCTAGRPSETVEGTATSLGARNREFLPHL